MVTVTIYFFYLKLKAFLFADIYRYVFILFAVPFFAAMAVLGHRIKPFTNSHLSISVLKVAV